jgi:2-polyprenyl-3-methyl-5-hydroxy-6-metoxy-1,4-benzoquinol methylase
MDLEEARAIIEAAQYWHYRFKLPWGETVPTKPGWDERVEKRQSHFFQELLNQYGGSLNDKTVLDLGCCQGWWSFQARKAGAVHVLGLDSCREFITEAKAVRCALGIGGVDFQVAHLEDDPWWRTERPRDVTLMLGVLYHLTDPCYVLRRAMSVTKETMVLDGEVALGTETVLHIVPRNIQELTTVRSNITSNVRAVPTVNALVELLKDGGFTKIRFLEPAAEMPKDYHAGMTASLVATR